MSSRDCKSCGKLYCVCANEEVHTVVAGSSTTMKLSEIPTPEEYESCHPMCGWAREQDGDIVWLHIGKCHRVSHTLRDPL